MRLLPVAAAAVEANSASALDPKTTEEAEAVSEAAVAPPPDCDEVITGEDETLGNWTTLSVVVLPVEVASEVVWGWNKSASITISNLEAAHTRLTFTKKFTNLDLDVIVI